MKAVRKISFKVETKDGQVAYYTVSNKKEFILLVAMLKKLHGSIVISNIQLRKVLEINVNNRITMVAKAG